MTHVTATLKKVGPAKTPKAIRLQKIYATQIKGWLSQMTLISGKLTGVVDAAKEAQLKKLVRSADSSVRTALKTSARLFIANKKKAQLALGALAKALK